jgi:23S rRNA pseudouridine2605 synthase
MRKRINSTRSASDARPSGDGQKTFRKSTDGGRGAARSSRPEAESRFSKPSIKRSSFRAATGSDSSRPNTDRPRFEKPDFDKPRSSDRGGDTREFKPRAEFNSRERNSDRPGHAGPGHDRPGHDRPRFDKPKFDKPRAFSRDGARDFKPRAEFDRGDRKEGFEKPRFDRPERSGPDRPRSDRDGASREFKPREGFEKPFNRADRDTRDFKPRGDFNTRDKKEGFGQRPERSGFDKPREDRDNAAREFKPRGEFNSGERGFSKTRTDRDGDARSFKPREERSFGDRPRADKPAFKKKDSEHPEVEQTQSDEGANRRVGRFESAPRYNLAGYEKKSGIKRKEESPEMRLNRYISNAGICSRREADDLIASGQISVNGKIITEMGYKVMPTDVVKYGKKALNPEKLVYILINKPKDYITTTDDPEERKTVLDLIQGACFERVYPVGRLDRNTTGLLLLTNDGELAVKLTHPSGGIKKIYQAELDRPITTEDFEKLQAGLELEDGFIRPDEVGIVTPDAMVIGLEIHSGRNRIVRRIFEHLGYEVQKLDRTVFAGLNKKELPRGKWRFLSEKEVVKLKYLL